MALTITDVVALVERGAPARLSLWLEFGEVRVVLRTNSPDLIECLADYFTGFIGRPGLADIEVLAYDVPEFGLGLDYTVKPPDPGKTRIKEEYVDLADGRVVRKRLTGLVLVFGGGLNAAIGPCLANDNQVINFINNRLIERELDRGALLLHAAAVSHHGRGIALAGVAGAGKSTLALHLMSRGLDFVSNDRLLLKKDRPQPLLRGVPKLPRINPGTALNNPHLSAVIPETEKEDFLALEEDDIWQLEHKYDVRIDDCFGPGRFVLDCRAAGLVILNWKRDGKPTVVRQVDLAQRPDLLAAVMKSPGLFHQPGREETDHSAKAYLDGLKDVTVIEISGGDNFDRAVKACLEVLDSQKL